MSKPVPVPNKELNHDGFNRMLARKKEHALRALDDLVDAAQTVGAENIDRLDKTLQHLATSSANLEKALEQSAALAQDMRRFASPENVDRLDAMRVEVIMYREEFDRLNKRIEEQDAIIKTLQQIGAATRKVNAVLRTEKPASKSPPKTRAKR